MSSRKMLQVFRNSSRNLLYQCSFYTSRAHPQPRPVSTVQSGLIKTLEGIEERKKKREVRWEDRLRQSTAKSDGGPYRNQDEMVEICLNLNVDPRQPGQNLRGSVLLPHGTGKKDAGTFVVFTADSSVADHLRESVGGNVEVGGEELADRLFDGELAVTSIDRAIASQDMMAYLSRKVARLLGPRGLMPNAKVGTLVSSPDKLEPLLKKLDSSLPYRTDKEGIINLGIGKANLGQSKLMDNLEAVLEALDEAKPDSYGKSKKKGKKKGKTKGGGKGGKYILSAYFSATQGGSVKLDPRTVDPSSPKYLATNLK